MKPILAARHRHTLRTFARGRTLLALDFDGTLAPIADRAAAAAMRPATARLLMEVARRYPCVIVSGRSRSDVARRVRPAPVDIVGNHGAEPPGPRSDARRTMARVRRILAPIAATLPGVWLEDKIFSLSLHYRNAPHPARVRTALRAAARDLRGVRVFPGKRVLNVVARTAPDKGAAVDSARRRHQCETAIYVGDDDTDEDVFRAARPGQLLGIRVGPTTRTQAEFSIRDQQEVDGLLAALVQFRSARIGRVDTMAHPREEALGMTLDFMRLLWGLDHALEKRSKRMATRYGVTGPQRFALRIIGRTPEVSAGRLAATLKIHPSTLTGVLQRLERGRLLVRRIDRGDRRRQQLELTPRGRALMKSSGGSIEHAVARVLKRTRARELRVTSRVLRSFVDALETGL